MSGLGSSMTALAYPLLALSVTDSAARAGLLGLVALAAGALMRLPAGAVIDRTPLRRILVGADLVRAATTAAVAGSLLTGHLALWQLLLMASINAFGAVFSEVAHSVAIRHVVPPAQLRHAFALNDGRGHAISLAGQPAGGFLYGVAPSLPLVADVISFTASAVVSATIKDPLRPSPDQRARLRLRRDLLTGVIFLWSEPFLRATLCAAAGYQLVFAGATFALIAHFTAAGATPASLGGLFAVAAVGGILGAVAAPALQSRLRPNRLVAIMGWTATASFAAFAWLDQPLVAGALLGCIYFTAAPANAVLSAAQITRTPGGLQGRVVAASYLIAGLVAPLGPPSSGALLDMTGQPPTFTAIAAVTGLVTVAMHLNRPMRTLP